jgi:D-alanyl-D-alanine dipeptidase
MENRMRRYSPTEPVSEVRRVRIVESGEPLAPYLGRSARLFEARPRYKYTRVTFLRETVADMLARAAEALPKGLGFAVVEGWRPPYIQRRMYLAQWKKWQERYPEWSERQLKRVVSRFTAPLHGRVPPPHSTGGAVDLVLCDQYGNELNDPTPYGPHDHRGYAFDAPGISPAERERRDLMKSVLEASGLTNYPCEWWHWSYGDQGWAYRTGAPHAVYGPVEPPGWQPVAEDDRDAPVERILA